MRSPNPTVRVYIETLGCPKNEADSGRLARRLAAAGAEVVAGPEAASHLVINTCGFIQEAVEESIDALLELTGTFPGRRVAAYGCLVERSRDELARELPEVDAWFGIAEFDDLVRFVAGVPSEPAEAADTAAAKSLSSEAGGYAYIKISDGCDHRCSFCAIPAIKGPYRALPRAEIWEQADAALAAGAGELVLVGQDTAVWYEDDVSLEDLIEELAADSRTRWLRLLYLQPENVSAGLLSLMSRHPKLCRYLDIPFQHASRRILRSMGRWGDVAAYRDLLAQARDAMPEVSLRSTFIVGYPGETAEDFEELLEFVQQTDFDHAGVFAFSPEAGTRAASLPGRPREEVVAERLYRLSGALNDSAEKRASEQVGRTIPVILDSVQPTAAESGQTEVRAAEVEAIAIGRQERQAPEIDGVVFVTGRLPAGTLPGEFAEVEIVESLGVDLVGRCRGS
ncbi:MAG: 30S ribosomal protein S12 methylthiotransferase RimO [Thermoleophilia bacterium]